MKLHMLLPVALIACTTSCMSIEEFIAKHSPPPAPLTFAEPLVLNDGCEGPVHLGQLGSSTVITSEDQERIYAVNRDAGTLSILHPNTGLTEELYVGLEPTRVTQNGTHVYVSLRGERNIASLKETNGSLEIMDMIPTGAEPFGIIASPDGQRIYAAISMENEVVEISTQTHEIIARWSIPNEPRWLAIHPSGRALFVASAFGDRMHMIKLGESTSITEISLPNTLTEEHIQEFFGMSEEEAQQEFGEGEMTEVMASFGMGIRTGRVSGDITISPDGTALFAPILYVDNLTPFPEGIDMSEFHDLEDTDSSEFSGQHNSYGESSRLMPGIGEIPLVDDEHGDILIDDENHRFYREDQTHTSEDHLNNDDLNTVHAGLLPIFAEPDEFRPPVAVTSFPTSVQVSSDCRFITATMEGMNSVSIMRRADICLTKESDSSRCQGMSFLPETATSSLTQMHTPPMTVIDTPDGPGGITRLGNELFVHALLDRSLSKVDLAPIHKNLTREKQCPENNWDGQEPFEEIAVDPFGDVSFPMCSYERFEAVNVIPLTKFTLSKAIEEGRRLFLSSRDLRMSGLGSSISCSTCHPGGRTDGNTWHFEDHPRQTPTLAGIISQTEPVSWFNNVPTVTDEVILTSQSRMGGSGLSDQEAQNVAAYIDWVRPVDNRKADELSLEAEMGRQLFEDSEVGCAQCHGGPQLTDNAIHNVNGVPVRTPKLRGIRATAPYLHDGSAPTLRDLVEVSNSINMGNLKWLNDDDLDYIVAYLESL